VLLNNTTQRPHGNLAFFPFCILIFFNFFPEFFTAPERPYLVNLAVHPGNSFSKVVFSPT
jgi:hypothetical protein